MQNFLIAIHSLKLPGAPSLSLSHCFSFCLTQSPPLSLILSHSLTNSLTHSISHSLSLTYTLSPLKVIRSSRKRSAPSHSHIINHCHGFKCLINENFQFEFITYAHTQLKPNQQKLRKTSMFKQNHFILIIGL